MNKSGKTMLTDQTYGDGGGAVSAGRWDTAGAEKTAPVFHRIPQGKSCPVLEKRINNSIIL